MSRLSDVLGGVYRDDDPTPDQHDSAVLDVAPDVDGDVAEGVWELDDDEPTSMNEPTPPTDPSDEAPVWDLQSVVDDPTSDWEPDEVFEIESEWAAPEIADEHTNGSGTGTDWIEDLADDALDDAPAWEADAVDDLATDRTTDVVDVERPEPVADEPEAPVAAQTFEEPDRGAEDDGAQRSAQSMAAASFGLLSAEEAPEGELDITDTGPWLRSDDDILPARSKRSFAFWRR